MPGMGILVLVGAVGGGGGVPVGSLRCPCPGRSLALVWARPGWCWILVDLGGPGEGHVLVSSRVR